ncbi:hypothetical protein COTS27_00393 [Spirochaetota bacterium]|nr:hypothetical protein COTS27_00393 [Spirochaetota bacterium]
MNIFYRKILAYPKLYSLLIGFIFFTAFADLRLWNWALYFNFSVFLATFFIFLKVYLILLTKSIEHYKRSYLELYAAAPLAKNHLHHTIKKASIQRTVLLTHLLASFWFVVLPGVSLLFLNQSFFKSLIVLFIMIYVLITIIRRLAFKFHLSMGRSFYLVARSFFITAIVSFLPLVFLTIHLITTFATT